MTSAMHIILSGTVTLGVPVLFAVRELIVLRRGGGYWRPDDDGPPPTPPPMPAPDGATQYNRPLPACLIPQPAPQAARARVLERA